MAQTLHELIEALIAKTDDGRKLRRKFHDEPDKVPENLKADARAVPSNVWFTVFG